MARLERYFRSSYWLHYPRLYYDERNSVFSHYLLSTQHITYSLSHYLCHFMWENTFSVQNTFCWCRCVCARERERERLQKNKKASPQFVKLDFHDEMSCYKNEFAKLVFATKMLLKRNFVRRFCVENWSKCDLTKKSQLTPSPFCCQVDWASGYGRRLKFERSWVKILAPYTAWTSHFPHFRLLFNISKLTSSFLK